MQVVARGRQALRLAVAVALIMSLVPLLAAPAGANGAAVISEIRIDQSGTDYDEYF